MLWQNEISQKHLENVVQSLFPSARLQVNARHDAAVANPKTGHHLEVDLWIPDLGLCFEFQDAYHYSTTWYSHRSLYDIKKFDYMKQGIIFNKTHTLVYVPYWWSGDARSLQATVHFQRPDLLRRLDIPIPVNPPPNTWPVVPDIGDLMLASIPVELPETLTSVCDEISWWMGEKYDGIRFCWHPGHSKLYSRSGGELPLPPIRESHFGELFIDGEFWCGRGAYGDAIRMLTSEQVKQNFAYSRHIAFDSPALHLRASPFEHRFDELLSAIPPWHPSLIVTFRAKCTHSSSFMMWAKHIIDKEGEGVVMRVLGSLYVPGRSNLLLKYKSVADAEALVISSTGSSAKLQLPTGRVITVAHKEKLKKGEVVTFGYTNIPQQNAFANISIVRTRKDLSWQDVLSQCQKDGFVRFGNPSGIQTAKSKKTYYMRSSMLAFFEHFAQKRKFDPRVASNWYSISRKELFQEPGGITILGKYFKGSLIRALFTVFPNIGLARDKFYSREKHFWQDEANRKQLFIDYAKKAGFDPLAAKNWYSHKSKFSTIRKMATNLVDGYYNGSVTKALMHLFPDIGLDINKLYLPNNTWSSKHNRRTLLIQFAKSKGINPMSPDDWYSFRFKLLGSNKEMRSVLRSYYQSSLVKYVMDVLPELNLSPSRFARKQKNYWNSATNRRNFFVEFARVHNFDPLSATHWLSVSLQTIKQTKSGRSVLEYYKNSHISALLALFPDIGLDRVYAANKLLKKGKKNIKM